MVNDKHPVQCAKLIAPYESSKESCAMKSTMREFPYPARTFIPEELMLKRIEQSEQMREFFIQMWLQNPALAKQGGEKVQRLLSPLIPR
jgi:hypothetical protein